MAQIEIAAGKVFEFPYPFVRDVYGEFDGDKGGSGYVERPTWKPGVRFEAHGPEGDSDTVADGVGLQRLWVIDVFRPGKFPARVFYTRQWQNPDGKSFGKGGLRIKTAPTFARLVRGYRHDFQLKDCAECKAMYWASRDHREHISIAELAEAR